MWPFDCKHPFLHDQLGDFWCIDCGAWVKRQNAEMGTTRTESLYEGLPSEEQDKD